MEAGSCSVSIYYSANFRNKINGHLFSSYLCHLHLIPEKKQAFETSHKYIHNKIILIEE